MSYSRTEHIAAGQLKSSQNSSGVFQAYLGTCLGVALYDNALKIGGLIHILLPEPYTSTDLVLVGPRLDITFTDKLFFTTLVQYNNQIDNVNVNMRFQWRFAPVSDLFIVYTENAFPEHFQTKDRGVVVKLSYWIN